MPKRWFSRYPNEQIPPFLIIILLAITALATAAPTSVAIWLANEAWSTRLLSVAAFLFFFIPSFFVLFLYFRQMSYKEMTYCVTSHTSIVETNHSQVTPRLLKGLFITYKEQPQTSVYLVVVEFHNTGNIAITKDDYKGAGIPLEFEPPAHILGASIKGIDEDILPDEPARNTITIPKIESEPGDLIKLSLFVVSDIHTVNIKSKDNIKFTAKRLDVAIQKLQKVQNNIWKLFDIMTGFLLISSVTLCIFLFISSKNIIWTLAVLLGGTSLIYLCITVGKLFIFIYLNKHPKI